LHLDSDLVAAAGGELGDSYLVLSRYWIIASLALAAALNLTFRRASSQNGATKASQKS
jgi:hypothetical protein